MSALNYAIMLVFTNSLNVTNNGLQFKKCVQTLLKLLNTILFHDNKTQN